METFDTNVVVRLIVKDDEAQSRLAERAWSRGLASGGVYLPKIVVIETVWVLRAAYGFDQNAIAATLLELLKIDGVFVEDEVGIRTAFRSMEPGSAGFADHLILAAAGQADALPVNTFDRRFGRHQDVRLLQ